MPQTEQIILTKFENKSGDTLRQKFLQKMNTEFKKIKRIAKSNFFELCCKSRKYKIMNKSYTQI